MKISVLACDVAGTTVEDAGVVIDSFVEAFSSVVPGRWRVESRQMTAYALETMGQSKIEVFTHLLGDPNLAIDANHEFERAYLEAIRQGAAQAIDGAVELFSKARELEIEVVLTTGFSRIVLDEILTSLNWHDLIDLSVTPSEAGRGRPHPEMLEYAARALHVESPESFVIVGDTVSDVQAALAFGAVEVYGVLTGAHDRVSLLEAGAKGVLGSVAELVTMLH